MLQQPVRKSQWVFQTTFSELFNSKTSYSSTMSKQHGSLMFFQIQKICNSLKENTRIYRFAQSLHILIYTFTYKFRNYFYNLNGKQEKLCPVQCQHCLYVGNYIQQQAYGIHVYGSTFILSLKGQLFLWVLRNSLCSREDNIVPYGLMAFPILTLCIFTEVAQGILPLKMKDKMLLVPNSCM